MFSLEIRFLLDDCTLVGNMEDIRHDLKAVEQDCAELGLSLSHQMSELIFIDSNTRATVLSCFPDI